VGTQLAADITLEVMGNLVDGEPGRGGGGLSGQVLRVADRVLALADPVLRRTRAAG